MNNNLVFKEAEDFTNHMSNIVMQNNVRTMELSDFAKNVIRIMNLDVEDRMFVYTTNNKRVIILFAKNTPIGKKNSAYYTERMNFDNEEVDIIILPNAELLQNITNPEILLNLDYVYTFILKTPKPSVDYVSPLEIAKHLYARYYFKYKFFINSFVMDEETINSLKKDLEDRGFDTVINFQQLYDLANNKNITSEQLFGKNEILDYIDGSVYYQILDDLRYLAGESDECEDYEESSEE